MGPSSQKYINPVMELFASSKDEFISAMRKTEIDFFEKRDPTGKEIKIIRQRVDAVKNKFEKRLKPKFNKWQAKTIKLFLNQMKDGSSILTVSQELKDELTKILVNHWLSVAEVFAPGTNFERVKQVEEIPIGGTTEDEDEDNTIFINNVLTDIENDVRDAVEANIPLHTGAIITTTEVIGNNAKTISKGVIPEASAIMRNQMAGRSTGVSVTETQWIAEESQNISIEATTPLMATATESQLKDLQPVSPNVRLKTTDIKKLFLVGTASEIDLFRRQLSNPQKMWVTMGDKRVRTSHRIMNGIQAGLNEAFKLIGGLMQFPADSSLGASFKEIAGCRCHCIYF